MHCGKKWWIREFVAPYIFPLNPDYLAARSLRSLRSNNDFDNNNDDDKNFDNGYDDDDDGDDDDDDDGDDDDDDDTWIKVLRKY